MRFKILLILGLSMFPTITYAQEVSIPNPARYLYNLGIDELKSGNADSALALFKHSASLDSTFPWVYVGMANAYYIKGDLNAALYANIKATKLDSTLVEPAINIGKIYFELQKYPDAINQLKEVFRKYPHILTVNLLLGQSYFYIDEYDSAEYYYLRALKLSKASPEVWFSMGVLQRVKGNYDDALFYLSKALELTPNSAITHYNIACVQTLKGNFKLALDELETTIKLDPNYKETIATDPCFQPIQNTKGFKKLIKPKKDKK